MADIDHNVIALTEAITPMIRTLRNAVTHNTWFTRRRTSAPAGFRSATSSAAYP